MNILVTGGAGFIGSSLAIRCAHEWKGARVRAFDNLRRRGSELALTRLRHAGVDFVHGDVRVPHDLDQLAPFDLLLECSAEPSVQAGYDDAGPRYVIDTNLAGTVNCLEAARKHRAAVIFLSTSRVYPIAALRALPLDRQETRFEISAGTSGPGWSADGIDRTFPLDGHRTMYGATKLAAELLLEEYRAMYGLRTIINRCGVIAGPWQMGKVDQGFVVLWLSRHLFGGGLSYNGFGGGGLQVRDVLHVDDLCDLVVRQAMDTDTLDGSLFNVGGGHERSVSLLELTRFCRELTGAQLRIAGNAETNPADVPYFVADNREATARLGWQPRRLLSHVLEDIVAWLREHRSVLETVLQGVQAVNSAQA